MINPMKIATEFGLNFKYFRKSSKMLPNYYNLFQNYEIKTFFFSFF